MRYVQLSEVGSIGAIGLVLAALAAPAIGESSHRDDPVAIHKIGEVIAGINMYVVDADEHFPTCYRTSPMMVNTSASIQFPAGWKRDTAPETLASDQCSYPNNVLPYWRTTADQVIPNAPTVDVAGGYRLEDTLKDPLLTGFTFNGLLNIFAKTAVTHPNLVPLIWTGMGRANSRGYAVNSPFLDCMGKTQPQQCVFTPSDEVMAGRMMKTYGEPGGFADGMYLGMVDGSVKRVVPNTENDGGSEDPWNYTHGQADTYWNDGKYPPKFRPDRSQ